MSAVLRKFKVLISVNHALMLAYRAEIYLWVLAHVLPFIMMGLWVQAAGSGEGFSMDPLGYKRYFLVVFCVRQFSAVWMIYEFEWNILEGRLSNYLLRPMHPLWYYAVAHLSEQLARLPFFLLIVGGFLYFNPDVLGSGWDWRMVLLGVVFVYGAFALRFALQWCFAMLAFWFERASSIESISYLPYIFLSGAVVPLGDFPEGLRKAVMWTPFPYVVSFPARVITGQAGSGEILQSVSIMAGWFAALWIVGAVLWRRGLRRYAGQGA